MNNPETYTSALAAARQLQALSSIVAQTEGATSPASKMLARAAAHQSKLAEEVMLTASYIPQPRTELLAELVFVLLATAMALYAINAIFTL